MASGSSTILQYRCPCGADVAWTADKNICDECQRPLPLQSDDAALTATLCRVNLEATGRTPPQDTDFELSDVDSSDLIRTGDSLGHFELQQLLGFGGMGAVYRALDTSLQRYVAVKVLRRSTLHRQPPAKRETTRRPSPRRRIGVEGSTSATCDFDSPGQEAIDHETPRGSTPQDLDSNLPPPGELEASSPHLASDKSPGAPAPLALTNAPSTAHPRSTTVGSSSRAPSRRSIDEDGLLAEAISQARINHPNVVTVYYVGREDEEPFFAMELLPGPTLEQQTKESELPFHEVIDVAVQVTDALRHAEKMGVYHGDIKPSNLILNAEGVVKLGDFGLARRREQGLRESGWMAGTPNYLAPEMVGGGEVTRYTDMYALGITLFELTFGRRPYVLKGDSIIEKLQTHETAEVRFPKPWPKEVPTQWQPFLERLLAKKPEERFSDYESLIEVLRQNQPAGSIAAGRAARLFAYVIDIMFLVLLMTPFWIPTLALQSVPNPDDWQGGVPFEMLLVFARLTLLAVPLVPLLLLYAQLKGVRSPGKALLQLRVVDSLGFEPAQWTIAQRSILRLLPIWVTAFVAIPSSLDIAWIDFLTSLAMTFSIWDGAAIFLGSRRTLHDRLLGTRVVLSD